jgi:hypothetical protein
MLRKCGERCSTELCRSSYDDVEREQFTSSVFTAFLLRAIMGSISDWARDRLRFHVSMFAQCGIVFVGIEYMWRKGEWPKLCF